MNDKAKKIGLKNTNFINSTGLDAKDHYSTAYDMSIIAKELVQHEKILEFSSIYEDYLRQNTSNSFWLVNTNKLVKFYSYIDGLKTGYTTDAGYCLTATGKKKGMRLITVVMGEDNTDNRTKDTIAMMDYGFNMYNLKTLIKKNEEVGSTIVKLGEMQNVKVLSTDNIAFLNNTGKKEKNVTYQIKTNKLIAPIFKGNIAGEILVYVDNKYKYSVDIIVDEDIKKANIIKLFLRNIKEIITGNIN